MRADEPALPDGMRSLVHPRRGGPVPASAEVDEGAVRTIRELTRDVKPAMEDMARNPHTYPECVAAVRAWLRGEPDPAGAAATASIVVRWKGIEDEQRRAAFVDAWAAQYGVPFAACAFIELCAVDASPFPNESEWALMPAMTPQQPTWWWGGAAMLRMRTLLATASDADHREAVTRLAAHRAQPQGEPTGKFIGVTSTGGPVDAPLHSQNPMIDPFRRLAVSYLVPTELEWMDECLAEMNFTRQEPTGRLQLLCALTGAGQVKTHETSHVLLGLGKRCREAIATLAYEIGPAVVPLMGLPLRHHSAYRDDRDAETRRALLDTAAHLPYDAAFQLLVDGIGDGDCRDALRTALDRDPERAIRLLAPPAKEPTTTGLLATGLLNGHLHAVAVPPKPDAEGLPELLVRPPWTGRRAGRGRAGRGRAEPAGPLDVLPARIPKTGWADPARLPRILVRGREGVLPLDATRHVLTMLAISKPGAPYAGLDTVRALCDPASLAEFSWALFAHWYASGAPGKDGWAFAQLGLLGDDATVRRLSPLIRAWPGEHGIAKATTGLDVLGEIGSDVALTHLYTLARRGDSKALKNRARQKIDEVATGRGLTADQLTDRAVPDFGLAEDGGTTFDYGPRRFEVSFDQELTPYTTEESGRRRKSLPAPGPSDDPDLAPAAHARFAALRKELRPVAAEQIGRLETAMVLGRRWTPGEFAGVLVAHPLLTHIVRRLVWFAEDGGAATAFRVAEDRTYADTHDDAFVPSEGSRIGLAHPVLLGEALTAWTELFADYEILQPFEQLARPVHVLTEAERTATRLARLEGMKAPYGKVKGFSQGRWHSDDGHWIARADPAGRHVVVNIGPGLGSYYMGAGDDQAYEAVWAGATPGALPESGGSLPLGDIDPVTMSEVIHDLTRIAH